MGIVTTCESEDMIDQVTKHLVAIANVTHEKDRREIRETVTLYPDDLIEKIATAIADGKMPYSVATILGDGVSSTTMREALCFSEHLHDTGTYLTQTLLRSLHHYPQLPTMEDYSAADEKTQKQCAALLTLTKEIYSRVDDFPKKFQTITAKADAAGNNIILVSNPEMVELLMEHPNCAQQAADLIIERGPIDAELIKAILTHETPALAEGLL